MFGAGREARQLCLADHGVGIHQPRSKNAKCLMITKRFRIFNRPGFPIYLDL